MNAIFKMEDWESKCKFSQEGSSITTTFIDKQEDKFEDFYKEIFSFDNDKIIASPVEISILTEGKDVSFSNICVNSIKICDFDQGELEVIVKWDKNKETE